MRSFFDNFFNFKSHSLLEKLFKNSFFDFFKNSIFFQYLLLFNFLFFFAPIMQAKGKPTYPNPIIDIFSI